MGLGCARLDQIRLAFSPGLREPELRARLRIPETAPLVLSVGRLIERKGFDLVLAALPEVAARHPNVRYLVVGDGPDRARLERAAAALGVADRVRFAGRLPDPELLACYRTADLFAMPARQLDDKGEVEGFGIVFLEAAACGLPAIAGRSGGTADAVEEEVLGCRTDPGDARECAARVAELLADTARRRALGCSARARVTARFDWRHVAARYLSNLEIE